MTFLGEVKPSLTDRLAHYGVKGMQWGVRQKRPGGAAIRGARVRQQARFRQFQTANDKASLSNSPSTKAKAARLAKEHDTHEDRVTASRMTRGEKAAALILGGPIGAAVILQNTAFRRSVTRDVDRKRANG